MEGWTLLSSDRQVVAHKLQPETELLRANLLYLSQAFPELYWQAPPSYLGDRVSGEGDTVKEKAQCTLPKVLRLLPLPLGPQKSWPG